MGYNLGQKASTDDWLGTLYKAVNLQFLDGVHYAKLSLMSDNGCQPTSKKFIKACKNMGITLAATSYNNPKGNADTERFMRTMKEELVWPHEWNSITAFAEKLKEWLQFYNNHYPHSTLGYTSPVKFEQETILHVACKKGSVQEINPSTCNTEID